MRGTHQYLDRIENGEAIVSQQARSRAVGTTGMVSGTMHTKVSMAQAQDKSIDA